MPFSAGGGADNAARIIAKALGEVSGQTVVVDNKAGASGAIGAALVARAKADGYTVLYDASSFAINPALRKLPYDPAKDFIAVSQAISVPNILVAAPSSPYNSLADFMNAARQKPGRLTYASYGPGSLARWRRNCSRQTPSSIAVHVPYKGGAPAIVDVMGGQVDVYFANAASSINYVKGGKLKALAVSSAKRMPTCPTCPRWRKAASRASRSRSGTASSCPQHRARDGAEAAGPGAKGPGLAGHAHQPGEAGLTPVGSSPPPSRASWRPSASAGMPWSRPRHHRAVSRRA